MIFLPTEPVVHMTRDEMESRRLSAAEALRNGKTKAAVARQFGVSRTTASRWGRQIREGKSLEKHRAPGRPRRIQDDAILRECASLATAVAERDGKRLTTGFFAQTIFNVTGVSYDPDHVGRIMRRLNLPIQRRGAQAVDRG